MLPVLVSAMMLAALVARHGGSMKDWGPWDWIAWGSLGISVLFLAIDTAIATLPNFAKTLPSVFQAKGLNFIPLAFFALGSCVFLARELGWIKATQLPVHQAPALISDIPAEKQKVVLQLQFFKGDVAPVVIYQQNVLSWFALWQAPIAIRSIDKKNNIKEQIVKPKTWDIFVVFERPSQVGQIYIKSGSQTPPPYQVKWLTTVSAIIDTSDDFPEGVWTLSSVD
jgi:hypothetical protein